MDHGCQYISLKPPPASDHRLVSLVDRLERAGAVAEWKGRFCEVHVAGARGEGPAATVEPSDDAQKSRRRICGVGGMNSICKALVAEPRITTQFGARVREISFDADGARKWHLHIAGVTARNVDENSARSAVGDRVEGPFDGLVASDKLLASDSVKRLFGDDWPMWGLRSSERFQATIDAMRATPSVPSFVLMLELNAPLPREDIFDAANIHGSDVIAWASKDSSKPGRGGAGDGRVQRWVIQSTGEFAAHKLDGSGETLRNLRRGSEEYRTAFERIGDELLAEFVSVMEAAYGLDGRASIADNILSRTVHRWGAAFPRVAGGEFEHVIDADTKLAVCGDWTRAPQAEGAAVSGIIAGEALVDALLATAAASSS